MTRTILILFFLTSCLLSCKSTSEEIKSPEDVVVVGAMKNVMWKGELGGSLSLDSLSRVKGLYGLGPLSYLQGELLLKDGQVFVSRVTSDSTMTVEMDSQLTAPFFVYGKVQEWKEVSLPSDTKQMEDLENFIDQQSVDSKRPFAFKLEGKVTSAQIHIQNLPEGTVVSSPAEAHQGQTNYMITNQEVEIIGFFSTEHQGIFTHHDSFLHMHLITSDLKQMGHLDHMEIGEMKLYLPKK